MARMASDFERERVGFRGESLLGLLVFYGLPQLIGDESLVGG